MLDIQRLTPESARPHEDAFTALLIDAVDNGASISFLPPLAERVARAYWRKIFESIADPNHILLAAFEDGQLAGSVQLACSPWPNGAHRAEVQKLIVHTGFRGQSIAGKLLDALEAEARAAGRSLLFLDTRRGDTAERLYHRLGWTQVGIIPQFAINGAGDKDDTVIFYKTV